METASKNTSRLPSTLVIGNSRINSSLAILSSKNVIAVVDQNNIDSGNVIVLPRQEVMLFSELNEAESIDMFLFAQKIAKIIEDKILKDKEKETVELVIRDGPGSGSIPGQVCIYLIPKKKDQRIVFGDYDANDDSGTSRKDSDEKTCYVSMRRYQNYDRVKEYAKHLRILLKKELVETKKE